MKILKSLLLSGLVALTVGCQDAKQVENIDVQDTKPVDNYSEPSHPSFAHGHCTYCNEVLDDYAIVTLEESLQERINLGNYDELDIQHTKDHINYLMNFNNCQDCANYEIELQYLYLYNDNNVKLAINVLNAHLEECNYPHTPLN